MKLRLVGAKIFLFNVEIMELKIEYLSVDELKPYERNNKKHEDFDVGEIAKSIEKYGMNDPIGIWKDNKIIEGHGRLLACKKLGIEKVPCVRLDHLTDNERREYTILHNKTSELAEYDFENLELELSELDFSDFDMDFIQKERKKSNEDKYTKKVKIPQYEIKGETPKLSDLFSSERTEEFERKIEQSDVTEEEKDFLKKAAQRHIVFDYHNIAEYYANAESEMQELMEDLALVIIDYNDAIANGYVKLSKRLKELGEENA